MFPENSAVRARQKAVFIKTLTAMADESAVAVLVSLQILWYDIHKRSGKSGFSERTSL